MDEIKEYSKLLSEGSDHLSFETLAIYANLNERLSDKERSFIDKHLNKCKICEERYNEILEEDREIDNDHEIKQVQGNGFNIFKYAAAASIIIAIGIASYFTLINSNEITEKIAVTETEIPIDTTINYIKEETVIAENEIDSLIKEEINLRNEELFAVNIVLENFIERNTRSVNNIEVLKPAFNASLTSPITFQWKRENPSGNIELIIVNNKNKKVFAKEVDGDSLLITEKFSDGLYYWKMKIDGVVKEIGKFKIE